MEGDGEQVLVYVLDGILNHFYFIKLNYGDTDFPLQLYTSQYDTAV